MQNFILQNYLLFVLDCRDKLSIAPCGIDNSTWDPLEDKLLPQSYSADDMRGKAICKAALQQRLGLPEHASTILVSAWL